MCNECERQEQLEEASASEGERPRGASGGARNGSLKTNRPASRGRVRANTAIGCGGGDAQRGAARKTRGARDAREWHAAGELVLHRRVRRAQFCQLSRGAGEETTRATVTRRGVTGD